MSAGVVPIDLAAAGKGIKGCQSALSVYPIAIANCAEKRYETVVWFQTVENYIVNKTKYCIKCFKAKYLF